MKIFKFGGASVKDAGAVRNIATIIKQNLDDRLLFVISAMGKTTNALENLLDTYYDKGDFLKIFNEIKDFHFSIMKSLFADEDNEIWEEVDSLFLNLECYFEKEFSEEYDYIYDQVVSYGELFATRIIHAYLNDSGLRCRWVDARNFIMTSNHHREGVVNWDVTPNLIRNKLMPILERMPVITQGFIGSTPDHHTTTLGREGSDFTASIFAFSLDADEVVIWKDVPGILNADPKKFIGTRQFSKLSYEEAIEMTYYGATVLHPKTIKPLQNKKIPLRVRSFLKPETPGTLIESGIPMQEGVPIIIVKENQVLVSLSTRDFSFMAEHHMSEIFREMARSGMKMNVMQKSAISFSICTDHHERKLTEFLQNLEKHFKIETVEGLELLTIRHHHGKLLNKLLDESAIMLEQKTGKTLQYVLPKGNIKEDISFL
ncbi:MAG: aspartate kinase [Bacteroidia bacterium]